MREAVVAALAFAAPATLVFAVALPPLARVAFGSRAHLRTVALFGPVAFGMALVTFGARVAGS